MAFPVDAIVVSKGNEDDSVTDCKTVVTEATALVLLDVIGPDDGVTVLLEVMLGVEAVYGSMDMDVVVGLVPSVYTKVTVLAVVDSIDFTVASTLAVVVGLVPSVFTKVAVLAVVDSIDPEVEFTVASTLAVVVKGVKFVRTVVPVLAVFAVMKSVDAKVDATVVVLVVSSVQRHAFPTVNESIN